MSSYSWKNEDFEEKCVGICTRYTVILRGFEVKIGIMRT